MKTVVNFLSSVGFVILTGLVAVTGNAVASTPDGETPANEGVCDLLRQDGVTKGLYGLCVAFCEAQDIDEVGDQDPPSNKILSNYNRKKQPSDPDMPCLRSPCPCWSPAELYAITSNAAGGIQLCEVNESIGYAEIKTVQTGISGTLQRARVTRYGTEKPTCRYLDRTVDPIISTPIDLWEPEFTLGVEDKACWEAVVAACP